MSTTNSVPRMVTLKEAEDITGISYHTLRQWCLRNMIVYKKAGNKYLINLDKLIEFLNGDMKQGVWQAQVQ